MYKLLLALMFLGNTLLMAQTGSLKIRVIDKQSLETIPFANVVVTSSTGTLIPQTSNLVGECVLDSLEAGTYSVKVNYVGYQSSVIENVAVTNSKTTLLEVKMGSEGISLQAVEMVMYAVPLIDPVTRSGSTVTREEYQNMVSRNISSVAATSAGVYFVDGAQIRGARNVDSKTANTEEYQTSAENDYEMVLGNPLSTFSVDVDAASYSNTRRFINEGMLPPKDAVRVEEFVNYFSYDYPQPQGIEPFSITTESGKCPWNEKHQLIHIGLQGKKIETERLAANNLVFLIDVSGSMESADKLPLLKSALILLVEQLREQDRISIVTYAGAAGLILSGTHGNKKEKIIAAIDNLSAGGSTAGGEGIILAYKTAKENFLKSGNNRVILATDGDFNVGVSGDDELVSLIEEKRNDNIFLTVLGFGTGNYKDHKMEQLADKGNGNYAYIDNILEAKKVLVKEMGATLVTIAKDVKVQVEFNPAYIKEYRLIGYENRLLADRDFSDDKKDAGEIGMGHTVTALYEVVLNEGIKDSDTLKYQRLITGFQSDELLTVKIRYKDPMDTISKLTVKTLEHSDPDKTLVSDNFKFAAAAAQFGLLLKDSKFKGNCSYKNVIALAKDSKGKDEDGYRAEFIRLAEVSELLNKETRKVVKE